jgi:uncharacterized protein (DUF2062 family)
MNRTSLLPNDSGPPYEDHFFKRRFLKPVVTQLTQGVSPRKIALTLALGLVLGVFPILGSSTVLCVGMGAAFKLNQVILQTANWALSWAQLPLALVFVRLGEWVVGADAMTFSPTRLVAQFSESPIEFLDRFWLTGLHGILGWILVAPLVFALSYTCLAPLLRRVQRQTSR